MAHSTNRIKLTPTESFRLPNFSAGGALVCSIFAALIAAFLIPFVLFQSCSQANITIFLVLFGFSAVLAVTGAFLSAVIMRRGKNPYALASVLFTVLYVALLIYLIHLGSL